MKKILLLIAISLFICSCGDEDNDKGLYYDTHNIILPENIDLDSFLLSVQLEADFVEKEFEEVHRNPMVYPHPVVKTSQVVLELKEELYDSEISITNKLNNNSELIYRGKLYRGTTEFIFNMYNLFIDDYGFYKVQVLNLDKVVFEKEIFYSNEYMASQKDENSPLYININMINLENLSQNQVNISSDFEDYFNKEIDRLVSNGQYLGTHKLTKNVRIALIKPFEYKYGDAIESGYSEVYEIVIPYNELKQLKEIIFKESDRIKDEEN